MRTLSSKILLSRNDCKQAAYELILAAKDSVLLFTQGLEPVLYNDMALYHHLSFLSTHNRRSEVKIIAHDTRSASMNGHCLIDLAQRLPSFVQIRCTEDPDDRKFDESWLIVDHQHFLRIKNLVHYQANLEFDNSLECKLLVEKFTRVWEACSIDQNTRRLSL